MNPAEGQFSPEKPRKKRLRRGQLAGDKAKKPRAKRGTAVEMKKKIAEFKRRQAAGANTMPLNSATLAYALLLNERKKAAGRAALTRRLDNPEFAKRYRQKILNESLNKKTDY